MRIFTLVVLPAHPAKIPVIAKNVTMQGGEDRPCHNGPQVLPIPKGQGGQVCVIACLRSCRSPRSSHLGRGFLVLPSPPPLPPPPPLLGASPPDDRLPVTRSAIETGRIWLMLRPPSRSTRISSREKGMMAPGASTTLEADAARHILSYWLHRRKAEVQEGQCRDLPHRGGRCRGRHFHAEPSRYHALHSCCEGVERGIGQI